MLQVSMGRSWLGAALEGKKTMGITASDQRQQTASNNNSLPF